MKIYEPLDSNNYKQVYLPYHALFPYKTDYNYTKI